MDKDSIVYFMDELLKPENLKPYKLKNGVIKFNSSSALMIYMSKRLLKIEKELDKG